jgi:predicted nucleotidyltransferase
MLHQAARSCTKLHTNHFHQLTIALEKRANVAVAHLERGCADVVEGGQVVAAEATLDMFLAGGRGRGYRSGMVDARDIEAAVERVVAQFHPEQVILFGSYAYGDPTPDSDIDLMVVMHHEGVAARKAADIRLVLPDDIPVDVIVRSPEKLEERLRMNDVFMHEIVEKGRVLYAA